MNSLLLKTWSEYTWISPEFINTVFIRKDRTRIWKHVSQQLITSIRSLLVCPHPRFVLIFLCTSPILIWCSTDKIVMSRIEKYKKMRFVTYLFDSLFHSGKRYGVWLCTVKAKKIFNCQVKNLKLVSWKKTSLQYYLVNQNKIVHLYSN